MMPSLDVLDAFDFGSRWKVLLELCCSIVFFGAFFTTLIFRPLRTLFKSYFAPIIPSTGRYFPAMDFFRGFAALWVATYHFFQWCPTRNLNETPLFFKYGAQGVVIFVILSGFLVYRSVKKITHLLDLKNYFFNRYLRIYPLYIVSSTVALIFHTRPQLLDIPVRWLNEALMLRAFGSPMFSNVPTWTLYVEEAFYLLLPAFVIAFGRRMVAISLLMFLALILFNGPDDLTREFMLIKFFPVGILLSALADRLDGYPSMQAFSCLCVIGGVALVIFAVSLPLFNIDTPYKTSLHGIGYAFIILGVIKNSLLSKILSLSFLRYLGMISYSIYLWHGLIISMGTPLTFATHGELLQTNKISSFPKVFECFFLFLPTLLTLSTLSYLMIERPFLKLRKVANQRGG